MGGYGCVIVNLWGMGYERSDRTYILRFMSGRHVNELSMAHWNSVEHTSYRLYIDSYGCSRLPDMHRIELNALPLLKKKKKGQLVHS